MAAGLQQALLRLPAQAWSDATGVSVLSAVVHPHVRQPPKLDAVGAVFAKLLQERVAGCPSDQPHRKATAAAVVEVLSRLSARMRVRSAKVRSGSLGTHMIEATACGGASSIVQSMTSST